MGLRRNCTGSHLLDIDIKKLLILPECPKLYTVKQDKYKAVEYAIYQYVNVGEKVITIADKVGCANYQSVLYWLKEYNVHKASDKTKRITNQSRLIRTHEFCSKCKDLFDAGNKTYASIARLMNCDESVIAQVAKDSGWSSKQRVRKFKWEVPETLPMNDIDKYSTYKRTIYHFSKKMVNLYFTDEQKAFLYTKQYHVDHNLSIYEAFNRGVNPLHWSLVCHPVNLQILSIDENLIKGRNSGLNPKELKQKIRAFDLINGKVLLPLTASSVPKYSNRWTNKKHFTFHYKNNNN